MKDDFTQDPTKFDEIDIRNLYTAQSVQYPVVGPIYKVYYSFKIFLRFWLVKTARIIHHNQLLLTKYWTNDVKSAARWKLLNQWRQNDVKDAARCRLLNHWPRKPGDKVVLFGEKKNKERNGETPSRTGKYFQWIIKQLLNSAADNTLLDLQNSSYPTQPHSILLIMN